MLNFVHFICLIRISSFANLMMMVCWQHLTTGPPILCKLLFPSLPNINAEVYSQTHVEPPL